MKHTSLASLAGVKSQPRLHSEEEAHHYGFRWGQVDATREASHKGYKFIGIRTDRQYLQVAITPTGLIRVYGRKL